MSRESVGWTFGLAAQLGVPDDVGLVYEFVNSLDHRSFSYRGHRNIGGDEFATVTGLRSWLRVRELIGDSDPIAATALGTARTLREGLRDAIAAHGRPEVPVTGRNVLLSGRSPLDVTTNEHGQLRLYPRSPGGVHAALGLVLIEAFTASATSRWTRLKMCGAPDCRWVFFDVSKPGTARWCETEICGNRMKKTNQRARRRERPIDQTR